MEFEIDAVDREPTLGHEAISAIGNLGEKWSMSTRAVILRIESKSARFFVWDKLSDERAEIGVVRREGQEPHIKTYANGRWANHLLALPATRDCVQID